MASIKKRGKYQWHVRIRKKGYQTQCKTFWTKADAESWASEVESEMNRGVFISRVEAEQTSLTEAIDRYILEYLPRLAHPDKEISRIKAIQRRDIASRSLASIRGKDIAEFIQDREAGRVSANTIRLDLACLSRLFEVAHKDWGMESLANPVKHVSKPKLPSGRSRRLEDGEELCLLEQCSPQFRPIVQFAIETAMRREEIASLRWENVDFKRSSIFLPNTKNGESRSVPLSPTAINILKALPHNISGSVFNLSGESITRRMRQATKKAEIKDLRFHDLRHEATSRFFENTDLDVMEIKTITGHKSLQMLARYSHLRTHRLANRLAGGKRG